jgi:hypothetical protein
MGQTGAYVTTQEPPPVGPAIEVEPTRRSLRRYLRIARLAALAATLLLICAAVLWIHHLTGFDLQTDGARTQGTVVSVSSHQVGNFKMQTTFLMLDYSTHGTTQHQRLSLGGHVDGFHSGQKVLVRYDPADATLAEVQGYPAHQGVPPGVPLVIGLIVLTFSWPGIRRARFLHRVLTNDPWDVHTSELIEVARAGAIAGMSGRARIVIRLEGMTGPLIAAPVGLRRLNPTFAPTVWVAAFGDHQMVVAPPGGSPIVCVRRVEPKRRTSR